MPLDKRVFQIVAIIVSKLFCLFCLLHSLQMMMLKNSRASQFYYLPSGEPIGELLELASVFSIFTINLFPPPKAILCPNLLYNMVHCHVHSRAYMTCVNICPVQVLSIRRSLPPCSTLTCSINLFNKNYLLSSESRNSDNVQHMYLCVCHMLFRKF